MKFQMKTAKVAAVAVLVVAFAGCGSGQLKTYPVQGQFKYEDGTVPMFGDVEFFNQPHRLNARGKINRDGTFTVGTFADGDGAVAGKHKIIVMQHVTSPLTARALTDREVQHDHGKLLSPHYYDYRTSDLECEVVEGDNKVELILKVKPNQPEDGLPKE